MMVTPIAPPADPSQPTVSAEPTPSSPPLPSEPPGMPAARAQKPTPGRVVVFAIDDVTRSLIEAHGSVGVNPNNGAATCPAVIVRAWSDTCVNLRLLLDGVPSPAEWKTSVVLGDQPGQWSWPGRV